MAQHKVRGIVIDQAPMGEKDKRLTVLTAELGKIPVLAKGAKSQSGRFSAPSQLFCLSDFVLDSGRTFYYIKEYEIIETFYRIRTDMDLLTYASILLEASRVFSIDGEDNGPLVRLLLHGLHAMTREDADPMMISQTFLMKLLSESGFRPELYACTNCGRPYPANPAEPWFFHPEEGGLVCPECSRGLRRMALRPGSVSALRYMTEARVPAVYRFQVSDDIRRELKEPIREYASLHAGYPLKSVLFAENTENIG